MPPKKAKTAAATPAKNQRVFVPETVTTSRGKEYETTAALARPRREIVKPATVPVAAASSSKVTKAKKAPATKSTTLKTTSAAAPKRGIPAKSAAAETAAPPAKKVGRSSTKAVEEPAPSKKRGRPSKAVEDDAGEPPKKRGRPSTAATTASSAKKPVDRPAKAAAASAKEPGRPAKATTTSAKKPGRPPKAKAAAEPEENPAAPDTPAPRKRGRGPKGGETTKISTDDAEAADQLEDELVDEANRSGSKRKLSAPTTTTTSNVFKGKAKATTSAGAEEEPSGNSFWLMKAEQVDRDETLKSGRVFNTKFTIDDLKEATAPEPWDGVRNMVARNNMRAMSKGDLVFFYASQSKGKLQPGITGIMEVVKEHEPDRSVYDEDSYGFVEPDKRKGENQWSIVHVEFRKKLSIPVTLKELQKYGGTGILGNMQVLKQSRLSVTKVTEAEWNFILNNLVEGYEDEDEENDGGLPDSPYGRGRAGPNENGDDNDDDLLGVPVTGPKPQLPPTSGAASLELPLPTNTSRTTSRAASAQPASRAASRAPSRAASRAPSRAASRQASLAPPVIQTTEAAVTSDAVDSAAQFSLAGSSKPASRAGSRKPASRAPSVKPASRAGSLAPPSRASSLGRSRTPKQRAAGIAEEDEALNPSLRSIVEEDFDFV